MKSLRFDQPSGYTMPAQRALRLAEHFAQAASGGSYFVRVLLGDDVLA